MKTLYLECNMGAAGDMLAAALLELHPQPDEVVCRLNHIGLPGVEFFMEPSVKCGITGSHFRVCINGMEEKSADHGHRHHEYGQGTGHLLADNRSICMNLKQQDMARTAMSIPMGLELGILPMNTMDCLKSGILFPNWIFLNLSEKT